MNNIIWGYSSVGRAPALHAGGQEFESLYLHHRFEKLFSNYKLDRSKQFKEVNERSSEPTIVGEQ